MPETGKPPRKTARQMKAQSEPRKPAEEHVRPPESAENFEHVIRRSIIAREQLRQGSG